MKRHDALTSLSHDHQHALAVAVRLRRVTVETAEEARAAFLVFWSAEGAHHFAVEETVLLPAFAVYGDPYEPLVARVLGDHVTIRRDAQAFAHDAPLRVTALRDLGERLMEHVRREERELFPLIERTLPPDSLAELGRALQDAERRPDDG